MDPYSMIYISKERIREFQGTNTPTEPFYSPFRPQWRKSLANRFYALASKLEPKYYPPRRLARK